VRFFIRGLFLLRESSFQFHKDGPDGDGSGRKIIDIIVHKLAIFLFFFKQMPTASHKLPISSEARLFLDIFEEV